MARKHFDEYFHKVSNQCQQLQVVLDDLSKEVTEGMIEPERLENLKATILPVKNSYETLNYIRYLLDMPVRKEKQRRYAQQHKKQVTESKTMSTVIQNNQQIIDGLKHT